MAFPEDNSKFLLTNLIVSLDNIYRKVASSRPVYYSILDSLAQRPQYISIKFQSENPWVYY